jgi:hypothetical protein
MCQHKPQSPLAHALCQMPCASTCKPRAMHAQEYVVQRLIKGVGSGQAAARQGFCAALTCLLDDGYGVETDDVLSKMTTLLSFSQSMKPSVCPSLLL